MSIADVQAVRRATDEPSDQEYSDALIETLVTSLGVSGAAAHIWNEKAGKYAGDVNVTEAGASHSFSDLHKNALAMAKHFQGLADAEVVASTSATGPRIKKIVRD